MDSRKTWERTAGPAPGRSAKAIAELPPRAQQELPLGCLAATRSRRTDEERREITRILGPVARSRLAGLALLYGLVQPSIWGGQNLHLEIEPDWGGNPLVLGRPLPGANPGTISVTRLDGLFSQLALQRADGSWLESRDWFACLNTEKHRLTLAADGLAAEEFQGIRFRVGLDSQIDAGEPQAWPPEHPLHPDVCGLHWGWRAGYIFLALEGHREPEPGQGLTGGFSYHLAGPASPMIVELPVRWSGTRPTTIRLGFDVSAVLGPESITAESSSTHSRDSDPAATRLKVRVARAFRVKSVHTDLYQPQANSPAPARQLPDGSTPFRVDISARFPRVKFPDDNPLTTAGVDLGRRLFHEARLSQNNRQACAGCHDRARAFTDGRPLSIGESGQHGRRSTMPLINLAWAGEFFWDGRARTLREQVLLPIQDANEQNERLDRVIAKLESDAAYPALFRAAFGTPAVTSERLALALEQYLLTLTSQNSRFDLAARNLTALSPQEQRGLQLFITEFDPARGLRGADCFHCHGGNLFTNHQFANNGLEERAGDLGRMSVTRSELDRGKFKVPTLRNVARTAPYMHDGRFESLAEVIEHYNGRLQRSPTLDPNLAKHPESGLGLSADDRAALLAFLETLTDESFCQPE